MKKVLMASLVSSLFVLALCLVLPLSAYSADKLVVKDAGGVDTVFVVTDTGSVGIGTSAPAEALDVVATNNGLIRLSNATTDNTTKTARIILRHYTNTQLPVYLLGAASTTTNNFIAFGGGPSFASAATQIDFFTAPNTTTPSGTARLTIKGDGKVGIGIQTPAYPLHMASGARVTTGGVWTDASSRELKENISELSTSEALITLVGLNPVKYNYKTDKGDKHVGFIAEDVPDLVATNDRKGMSPMDVVAVLTKVVQEQQNAISYLTGKITELERESKLNKSVAFIDK